MTLNAVCEHTKVFPFLCAMQTACCLAWSYWQSPLHLATSIVRWRGCQLPQQEQMVYQVCRTTLPVCSKSTTCFATFTGSHQQQGKRNANCDGQAGQWVGEARRGRHLSRGPAGRHVCWAWQQSARHHVSVCLLQSAETHVVLILCTYVFCSSSFASALHRGVLRLW